ncbi:Spectrin alpha actinin [Echinococcus multilocularis]|uniref:Spectrin alpha actinin n=1 Tax=Echinococcus multilocularis TaxID=6211 RepID=A0A068Y4F3_ECHMU|nr:Spectrin alpha actinin [Echinococcus multilocularis]
MSDDLEHVEDSADMFTNEPMDLEQIKLTLAIMQLDPADRAVIRIADQRDAMQKRAFTIWVNKHLSEHGFFVNDLFRDFQSGHLLIKLIEILSGQSLSIEYGPTRVHCIQNVQRVLEFLRFRKVRIVNIRPDEIVDGNPKLTLGLIWIIILHFHLSDLLHLPSGVVVGKENALPPDLIIPEGRLILNNGSSSLQSLALLDETAGRNLLSWCRAVTTGYRDVDINDFSSSWSDGRAFLAIIHRYKPHFFDYSKAASRPPKDVLDFAFRIAEERLGITRLIYPEDMVVTENAVDSRSVIVYVSSLYDALALSPRDLITGCRRILPIPPLPVDVDVSMAPPPLGSQLVTTANVSDEIRSLWSEYRLLAAELIQWLRATCDRLAVRHFPADLESMQQQVVNDLKRHRREELPLRERQRQQLVRLYADLQSAANANLLTIDPFMNIEHIFRLWKEYDLALQKREMAVAAETSRLERLQLAGERIERECRVLQTQEAALEKRINEIESQFASSQSIDVDGELERWMTQMEVVETGVNNLFGQVQILRNGRYIRTEQAYRKVCTLHQRLLELQRRCRNFLKVTSMNQSGDRIQALQANGDSWMAVPAGRSSNSLRWLAKQNKHFGALQAAQDWMQERKEAIKNASFGDNRKSIADATKRFELIHREIEKFHSEVEGCQALRAQVSGDEVKFFEVLMNQIEIQYDELMKKSKRRLEFGRSLLVFVERASNSMQWLREKETIEVTRIWSSPHELKSDEIYEFFQGLLREIQSQEQQFNEISTLGSSLHLEGHPSFDLIQNYLTSLDSHWAWLLQLTHCLETRLDQTVRFQQFFTEAQKVETFLTTKMKEINDMNLTSASGNITVEIASEFMKKIADMGEVIRGQGFLVDKLVETSDEIGDLAFRNDSHETVISICFFAPNSEPHYMELAPEQSDPAIITWPSGDFKKGERMTIFEKPSEFTLKLRHSNGEEIEAPAVCFLPARPCLEAKTRAQDVVACFQRLQVFWADTELNLHGRLLRATMQALPGTLPNLSAAEGQQLMRQLHEDTQRHLVGMRLANKPIQEVEVFQQESEQSFNSLPNGIGSAVDPIEKNETTDLKRIETTLNALADHLRKRTGQVLPNQLSTLEVVLKEHKEWSRSVNQIRDHLERMPDEQGSASTGSTIDNSGCAALLAAANELTNAGKATAHRLAEVDTILTRLDSLQRELAGAELKVVGIAARIHSPQQNLSSSKSSLHSDVSEMEANNVQDIHDQLKNVTLALGGLRKMLEQLPHHLTALSTLGVTKGTSAGNHRLPPPNTSLLEKSIFSVNTRLGNLINQIDLMNQELVKISQNYKTVVTLRRGLTLWLRETSDLVEAVEMRLKNRSHGNLASSTAARNLERASAEAVHCEAKLKELNQTCEFLARSLEDSAGRGDAYKRAVSCLTFASMETANTRFVGPPGIGVIDLVSLGSSVANLNTQFQALKSKIADNLAVIGNATDETGEGQSAYNTISSHRSTGSTRSLLSPFNDVGDYFVTGGSCRRRRRKISPSVPLEQSQMKRRPLTRKPTRYCVVSGFYLTSPKQSLRVETAITRAMIREGRVDVQRNLVYDSDSGAMITAGEALEKSVIVGLIFTKLAVKQTGETTYWLEIFHKRHDVYLVEGIFDVNARTLIPVEEALASNLIDPVHGLYHHTGTEETITLEDAHQQGLIRVVPQLRPPCEDLATRPFDFIHYRTVEGDFAVWSSNVAFKQKVDLFVQQEETVKSGYANIVVKNSKLPLDLHLLGNLAPVTMTDGTAISAIKLPLVRRLVSQNIPTIEVTRREPQPARRLSLATALRRGWIDSYSGGLRSACGSVSQVNLIEAVEQRFVDPNSIIVRIGGDGLDASNPGTRYYSLARVLEAANTIARAKSFASEAGWKNELLKILMTNNANADDGEVSENISPEDYSRLQSIIVHNGIKRTKGDKKMSLAKLTLKRKQKKGEQPNEKLSGEKMSLARAIQAGRFDPSTGIITTQTMQQITLKEAIELKIIDEEISLVQDERTGYYRSVSHYLNDGTTPIEVWVHWPMATILLPEEVEPFGRKRVNRGQRIPYAAAQSLHLVNPQSRTVFNPQIENYVSILNAFLEGPLCGQRTVIYFRTSQEYLPADKLILLNPENVVNELLFNRSLCIELQKDIDGSGGGTHPPPHVPVKTSVDSIPSPILVTPVDLKTAVSLSWVDRQTGFVNDPYTGHRLLLKEAVSAGLIDANRTVIRDPVTHQTSTLNVILKSGEPINVPYIVQLACLEDSQEPSTQACSGQNQSTPLSPVTDGSFAMTPTTGELRVTNTSKGQEVNDERFLIEEEYPLEGKSKAGGKMFDEAMENAEKHEIIGLDAKKLRSDLADAAAKVGAGLAVALGAAGVGDTLAYQSIKEKIKRGNASHSQIQSPTVEENLIASGPIYADTTTKSSEEFKRLFVPNGDKISTDDAVKRDDETKLVNDDVEVAKLRSTDISGSSVPADGKELQRRYDEKTAFKADNEISPMDTDDALRSEISQMSMDNLGTANEGTIFLDRNDKNLLRSSISAGNSIFGTQDVSHSISAEDGQRSGHDVQKIGENDKRESLGISIGGMEFIDQAEDLSRPSYLASMEVPETNGEERSPLEEQGYSRPSSREHGMELKRTSPSTERWEANEEGKEKTSDPEKYSTVKSSPIAPNHLHSVDSEDATKCERILLRGRTMYPSEDTSVNFNAEDSQDHFVEKTPSIAEDGLQFGTTENKQEPNQETKEGKTELTDQCEKQAPGSSIFVNKVDEQKHVADPTMELSEATSQKPPGSSDSATSRDDKLRYEVDLTKNAGHIESSVISGADQNAEEPFESGFSGAENNLNKMPKGEPINSVVTQGAVALNKQSLSKHAPSSVANLADTSKEAKKGFDVKKVLINIGGVLTAAVGAPVVAGIMAYNAAKEKFESSPPSSKTQNKSLEIGGSVNVSLEPEKVLTTGTNPKKKDKSGEIFEENRLPRMGKTDDLSNERQCDLEEQQQQFQPPANFDDLLIPESNSFEDPRSKSPQKGEELPRNGTFNKQLASHDPNQAKDDLLETQKEVKSRERHDQPSEVLRNQGKVDLIQEGKPIQSLEIGQSVCNSPRRSPESNSIRARERESVGQVKSPDSGAIDELTLGNDRPSKNKDERWGAPKWGYRKSCSSEAKVNRETTEKDYTILAVVEQCRTIELFTKINISHGLQIKDDDNNINYITEKKPQRGKENLKIFSRKNNTEEKFEDKKARTYAGAEADAETEAVAVVERDEEGKAEAKVNAGEGEVLAGVEDEAEGKVRGGGAGMGDGVLAEGAVAVVDVEEGESVIRGGERGGDVASEDDKWLRSDGRESVAPTDVSGMEGAYLETEAVSRVGTEAGDAAVGVVGAGDGDGFDDADSVSGGAGLVGAGGVGGQSGVLRGIAGRPCMEELPFKCDFSVISPVLGFRISPIAIGVPSVFSRPLFGVSCPLSLPCSLPGHLSGGLSPILEEDSFPHLRFSGGRNLSFPDSVVSRSMPFQPEVNYARLFSGLLKELDAESAWLLTRQERILNECSISLNDDDNQKLLDQHYEINNDLLTHKQVALAVCERAELLAKEAIASLPSEKRSLLETKAMEVRSAFQQLTQETDVRIHLLTASLDNLEQLTFQLQDLKAWLTSIENSLKQTLETYAPHPESLSAIQAHISRVEHELLSRQTDLASVMSSAQKFLSCLEKYNSAKLEYASLVGVELPVTQSSAESIVPSVETAVDWTQNKFNELEALAGEHSTRYSDAAMGFSDFATGLAKCSESLDAAEKTFWQATRKLLAAGVNVNPRCEGNACAPANTQMITNPVLVKDQASCIFALEGHILHIKSALEALNVLADDLSKSKLPAVLVSPSTIETCLNKPLETEESRLSALSKELTSMKVKIKSLLSAIDAKDGSLGEKSAWLEDAIAAAGGKNESTLLEARQANNKLQAELSVREPGLQSLLRSAQEELEELEKSGEQQEATEKVKEKVVAAQKLVDKCTELQSRLSRDQILLDELEKKSSLLDQASKNLDAFLESARSDLSAIESGLIPEGESYKRLKAIEEMENSQTAEFNLFEEDINKLALEAIDLGRESDITTAKKKTAAAWAELSDLNQSIRQAHQTCKERLLRAKQFKTKRAKLLDWLRSLEKRLNAGIFADCSTDEEVSLREQLKELEKVTSECNALASEVESACGLLKPSENSSDDKLVQDAENLKNGCERLKSRIFSMQSTAASSLRSLEDFSNAFMEADAWLTQRLNQISQLQLSSVDPQEILALTKKLNRFKDELEAMAPQIDGLRRLGNELLNLKGAGKGSGRISEHMADVEKKWQALDAICKHRASELSKTYSQALALDQCYSDLDNQLSRHSRAFEALSTVPVSKGHLQKLLFIQFGLIRTKPTVHAFEEAAGQFINSLPATTDASELSARVSGSRSRFDGLIGAIESRLETLQNTLCAKRNDAVLERQDLEEVDEQAIPTGDEETAKPKEIILKESMFDEKPKGSKDEHFSASETDERGELEPLKGPPTETDSKTSKIDDLKERMAAFQAWLDLESRPVECPIFESGSYPVTRSNLTKAVQRVETFMTLIESRGKHLASLCAEAEVLCPDLLGDLEKCQASLDHVKRRYTKKTEALQEILDKSKPIETELQSQQLTIDDLESQFLKDLGSTSRLESLQQDVMNRKFPTLDSQIRDLERTLSKLGDESSNQSAQPLRQQEVGLSHRLKQLESSLKRSIEGGQDGQKATSSLLTRADLIKRRMDELEAQVEVAGSEDTVLDPDTLSSRLEDVNKITDKLKQCDAALKSLKGDRKDLPQLSLLESLLKGLKRQSSRISEAADEATERLGQKIKVAQQLADQQKLLSSSLADARTSSPIQPHKPLLTPKELKDYERQYLTPLRSQLQQLQKTGATLNEMSQPGLGRRRLEQDLTATEAAVDSLFAVVSSLKEHIGDASTLSTTQDNNIRRLESLVQSVRDELEGQGALSPSPNALQLDALLNKLTGLRNLLQSRRGSLELLAEAAKAENHPDSVVKLIDDYQNVFAEVDSRIDKVSDALLCLKEFNSFYESYLGWLADAESRFSKLPISRDPAITYANRVAELGKLSQDCADKTDSVIQLQTRGTELLGLCPDSGAPVIKEKMEHVGLSFTEFFDKVNNASQGLESARPDINRLLDSNAYLIETLPKLESRLRDGESTKIIGDELNSQVKPHVDSLTNALEEIRTNLPNALFLDLPSQLHSLTIGDLAVENVSRFNNLYSETMSASQKDQLLDMQVKNAYSKLRGDEKWLEQAMRRLDPKAQSQPPREILTLKKDTSPESASYSLAVLPARAEQIDYLISRLNAFRSQLAKRQPDIEAHLVEAKRLLDKVPYRNTEEDLAPMLEGLVKRIIQQNKEIDGLMDAADARSQQALALSKSLFDNLARLDTWMTSAENVLNQLPVAPLAVEEESDTLRKLHVAAKTLERELDGYKVTLEQASSTAAALSALTAPSEADGVDTRIQQSVMRFRKLSKRIRNRSIDLEDAVTNSFDVNDRLNVLHEVLNETRDLAATIGVRLEPPSHDLSPPHLPSEFDLTSIAPSARVLQPVSMRSEYLSSQIAEGKAILDTLERRLPALAELASSIEERLSAPASEMSSRVERPSLVLRLEEEPTIDASVLNKVQSLQKDWLQLQTKVSQRLTNLVEAHRLASEEFWLPLANFQGDLIALRRAMDAVISGGAPRLPLEPLTYTSQIEALKNIGKQHGDSGERLNALQDVGNKIINLLIDETARSEGEKGILKKEINNAIREVSAIAQNITTTCEQQLVTAKDNLSTAQKLQTDMRVFMDQLEKAENEFEAFEPVANNTDVILKLMEQLEEWSALIPPRHEQLENLNWVAGQLMSAVGISEVPKLPPSKVGGDTEEEEQGPQVQQMLTLATTRWSNLNDAINHRRHKLQTQLMALGDFDSALDALIQWIKMTQADIDGISVSRGDKKSLEFELSRAKIIQTNAARRQPDIVRINQEAKAMRQTKVSSKLTHMNRAWERLKQSVVRKQAKLEEALREAQSFYSRLDELRRECRLLEGKISAPAARLIGGLPDSAKQSLNRLLHLHNSVEKLGRQIGDLRSSSAGLLASASSIRDHLVNHLDSLSQQQAQLAAQAQERLKQVQSGVARVATFHNDLGDFIQWLTQAERRINQAPTISFVPYTLQLQLPAQVALRQEIASKREAALTPLDRAVVFIGSNALEQDVVLVKNLLASAHSRWEKLFQKSADRNRQFAVAFKESQKLMSVWKELTDWLKEELNTRLQESSWCSVSTQPDVLLRELTQHREFQRELGAHSATYDAIRRHLIKVKDRAPRDDLVELNRMLSELKYFWNAVCTKSLEKQKVLEEALLRSGQYKEAFVSLFEWINKIDSLLDDNEKKGCGGDVETVKQLEEAHRNLLAQLQEREASVTKLQTAASQLLTKCRPEGSSDAAGLTDSLVMQEQLAGLNAQWTKVQLKAKARSDDLKLARKNAEEFQKSCQDVFDYCAGAEYTLRKLSALSEGDDPCVMDSRDPLSEEKSVNKEAAAVTSGMAAQESRVCDCLARGNRILSECKNNLDGASRIRQWMNAVNTRWEEMLDWSQKREAKLAQLWKDQRERRLTLDALISWLNTTEVILSSDRMYVQPTISMGPLSVDVMSEISSSSSGRFESGSIGFEIDTSQVERLLIEVGQIESELEKRRFQRDEVLKHARKSDVDKKRQANSKGKASEHLPRDQGQAYASVRVNEMCEKWDRVVRIVKARQIALEERLAHANEVEKLKTFDFGNWRRRYLDWMNSKKARLIDMFYRYDLDRDGRLSRDEFVNAILESKFPTSRLELEVVASIVDANGDAYIDMKKFNTALRSTTVPKSQQLDLSKIEGSAIEHEAKHQTNLCTCHNTYRISKINGNMYKFGDSQKLRLVRILRSNVMVRVGGGWTPLTEFLVKNDPCRATFWAGSESERKDAGFPEDQTHMMLRFHPRFRDGSSASVTCTDPTCSGHLDNMPRSSSRRSNPRHASTSGGIPFMCTSPVPTRGMDHLNKKEGHRVPVQSSLPIVASRRKANSLVSFCQSSLSSSAHSLPIVEQSVPGGSHSSPCTEPVELETEATIPPTSPSSSLSELPEDRKGSSRASGMNVANLIPAEESVSSSTEVDVQQHASLSHLSSILERYEGDDPRLTLLLQNEEVEPDLTTATSTTLTQSHMQLPLPRVTSSQQPEVASCETNLPHSGSQVSISHTTEPHPGTALSRTRTTVASFRREINNERFRGKS